MGMEQPYAGQSVVEWLRAGHTLGPCAPGYGSARSIPRRRAEPCADYDRSIATLPRISNDFRFVGPRKINLCRVGKLSRSEEHTSELQSLMRNSYAVFCLKKKKKTQTYHNAPQYS